MDKIISNNIVELTELLVNKRFTYKNETFICTNVKLQQGRTIIFTDKRTLGLYLSELQLIEVIDEISEKELKTRVGKLSYRGNVLSEKNLEAKKKVAANVTSKMKVKIPKPMILVVPSERGPGQPTEILSVSPKKGVENKVMRIVSSSVKKPNFDPKTYINHVNSPFTQEDNLWIIENVANYTVMEISQKFESHYQTTYNHIKVNLQLEPKTRERSKKHEVKPIKNPGMKVAYFSEEEKLWIKENASTHTLMQIAEKFKVSYSNTYNYVVIACKLKTVKGKKTNRKIVTKVLNGIIPKTNYDRIITTFVERKMKEDNPEDLKLGDFVYFKNIKDEGIIVGAVTKFFTEVQVVIPRKYERGTIVKYSTRQLKKIEKLSQ